MESADGMATYQATFRAPAARALAAVRRSESLAAAWRVFWPVRALVLLVAIFAALSLGPPARSGGGLGERNAWAFDREELTHPLGGLGDLVLSPLARWDARWFLEIADTGYADAGARAAFFPAYPGLVRLAGVPLGGGRGGRLVASYLVSLAALLAALALLHRLVVLELGRRIAPATLLLISVFPAALYFGAPYSESLFLLASVGAFLAARTGRWALAGAALMLAASTRSVGVLLVLPLAVLWLEQPGRRARDAAWLLLAPAGLGAYALYLGLDHGDALAFLDAQEVWRRDFVGPLIGAWDGFAAAVDGARQLLSGSRSPVYFEQAGGDPFRVAGMNLMLFAFLVFALVGCVGVLRRLPPAYGLWTAVALLLPLSYPVPAQPLMSLPRFLAVLFPLFMWLALVCEDRRMTDRVAAVSAVGLGLFTTQFATWHWIA